MSPCAPVYMWGAWTWPRMRESRQSVGAVDDAPREASTLLLHMHGGWAPRSTADTDAEYGCSNRVGRWQTNVRWARGGSSLRPSARPSYWFRLAPRAPTLHRWVFVCCLMLMHTHTHIHVHTCHAKHWHTGYIILLLFSNQHVWARRLSSMLRSLQAKFEKTMEHFFLSFHVQIGLL